MKREPLKQIALEITDIHIKHMHTHRHTTMNADTDLTHFTKNNSKHIIDLNVKCKSNKLLENNTEGNVGDSGLSDEF